MARKEVKSYAAYPPPWWDNNGSACVDPSFGISESFIKDKILIEVPFDTFCKKFSTSEVEIAVGIQDKDDSIFADTLSFVSQDGLIFYLFGNPEGTHTHIWQVYFDDNYRYPPNINDSRKESTAFKRWLLNQ